ncbi:MAG: glycosyltransferase 87 family protein, partial [Solirubrobacteraceae bacterium]
MSAAADTRCSHAARLAGVAALILLGAIWVAWLGFRPQVMGDYPRLFAPSMNALLAGHVGVFFANLPTDGAGGSVLLRAPFALIGKELVGGQHAIFRFGALGCLLISVGPALWVVREMRLAGRSALARGVLIAVFLFTPAVLGAILYGHPEEPLGASLCIAAVLLAASGRCGLAGVILGLAMINKPWAALAIPPVLLAAPAGRLRLLAYAGAIAGAWIAAAYIGSAGNFKDTIL